jgi:hypothetical protein
VETGVNAAPDCARWGWPVFPVHGVRPDGRCTCGSPTCENVGKHPRESGWQKAATTEEGKIRAWSEKYAVTNWGMPTGCASGVDVLDEDPRHGGDATIRSFEEANGPLPETVRVLTQSGGVHRWFRHDPAHPVKNGKGVLGPGVDVRGDGGFVVVPPSVGATGRAYSFDLAAHPNDVPLADWTEPLLRRVNGASAAGSVKPPLDVAGIFAGVPEGEREGKLVSLVGKLRRADVPLEVALGLVLEAASRCIPPFPPQAAEERVRRLYATYPAGSVQEPPKPAYDGPEEPDWLRDEALPLTDDQLAAVRIAASMRDAKPTRTAKFIDLYDLIAKPADPIPWQVEGYMSRGESVTLGGEWGSGKSLTALDLAISLACGTPWMDHVPIIGGPYRVIYLDEENGRALAERRIRQLLKGRALSPEAVRDLALHYTTRNGIALSDPTWYDWLARQIEERKATHLFLDSLIRFSRVDENSNSEIARFFGECIQPLMSRYDLSVCLLDHLGKPSRDRTDAGHRLRGASDKPAVSDGLVCLDGERGQDTRTLTHEKTRWNKYQPPLLTTCTESDDEETCWITAKEEKPEAADQVARMIHAAARTGVLREELVKALSATAGKNAPRSVSRAIKTLRTEQAVKSKTEGKRVRYWTADSAPAGAE